MPTGLHRTEQALAKARNRAVLPVLAVGLHSSSPEVRAAAIRATMRRLDIESHTQLIRHYHGLSASDREILRQQQHVMSHHSTPALKAALLSGDATLCRNACDIILLCQDYQLFETLLKAAKKPSHQQAASVAATLLQLAVRLHDEVIAWTKGKRRGSDPSFARHHVLASLERALRSKTGRHPPELVDALLLIAPSDSEVLWSILRDGGHPCHRQMVASLVTNSSPAVIERLVAMLRDTDAPAAALEAVGRRNDRPFVEFLLHELKRPVPLRVLHNAKRLRSVAWLDSDREMVLEFDGAAQAIAVEFAVGCSIEREVLYRFLKLVLQEGLSEGRRASCTALAGFKGDEANNLVLAALNDQDAGVQAAAVRQLRQRKIPDALQMLVVRLESPFSEIREAARSSLAEFNFVRYRAMFELLDEQAARSTGMLVRQVDHSVREKLVEELTSPSVTARLRGIEMAVAMGAVEDVRSQLIELSRHDNAALRKESVAALAFATGAEVVESLEIATGDSNRSVSDAARQSLSRHKFASADAGDAPGLRREAT